MMTGRQRLNAILRRQPREGLSWTTEVDGTSLAGLPVELRGHRGIDFYRDLGCDMFLNDSRVAGDRLRTPEFRWCERVEIVETSDGHETVTEWRTPHGTLKAVHRGGHPVKYPVDSIEALRVYRAMWEAASFTAYDDTAAFADLKALVGDDGIVTRFWGMSAIPRLLQMDMGVEHFYYMLADHPGEMDALIRLMHERMLEAYAALAAGPWDCVLLCENTSTLYISPDVYRTYNGPHQGDFVEAVHAAGKVALLHMCGHVCDILEDIRETGCDGIQALTPPPTGNTPWEKALDVLGDEAIIIGLFDPSVFVTGPVEQIGPALDACMTPRLRESNFVLWLAADGIRVPEERFRAVGEWFERNGGR